MLKIFIKGAFVLVASCFISQNAMSMHLIFDDITLVNKPILSLLSFLTKNVIWIIGDYCSNTIQITIRELSWKLCPIILCHLAISISFSLLKGSFVFDDSRAVWSINDYSTFSVLKAFFMLTFIVKTRWSLLIDTMTIFHIVFPKTTIRCSWLRNFVSALSMTFA